MALNERQKKFVAEYLVDLNATQAAIRAGYSKKTAESLASRLLRNVKVRKFVAEQMKAREERTEITQDYVLSTIVETIERCKQARPVTHKNGDPALVETPDGQMAPAYAFDPGAILKGAELLGKHLRLFADSIELKGKITLEDLLAVKPEAVK